MKRKKVESISFTYLRVERKTYAAFVEFCKRHGYQISTHAGMALDYYRVTVDKALPGTIEHILKSGGAPLE